MPQQDWSVNRQAAKAVALHFKGSIEDTRELLDMIGLLDDTGRGIAPDDNRYNELPTFGGGGEAAGRKTASERMAHYMDAPERPELLTSPPALRLYSAKAAAADAETAAAAKLAAKATKPKPVRKPRPVPLGTIRLAPSRGEGRPVAVCGTLGGRRKHKRLGEGVCADCKIAYNAWQRERNHRKKGNNWEPKRKPAECGTPSGRKRHYREKTPTCEPCLAAARKEGRRLYHAAQAKRREMRDTVFIKAQQPVDDAEALAMGYALFDGLTGQAS